jgi:polygalacturonase
MATQAFAGGTRAVGAPRRSFLRATLLLALPALVPGGAAAFVAARPASSRDRGTAKVSVRDRGAHGDGRRDDTAAFQAAIDALPVAGGTVEVPAGRYLIDPLRSVRLRSRMHLQLAPGATLLARPNAAERAYVLSVHRIADVEISGGRIIGDRDAHAGGGEWGHGIMIRSAQRVTVRNVHVSRCWGDGISIGGSALGGRVVPSEDVLIDAVVCTGNRRQGLTIGRSRRVHVRGSEFSGTAGVLPGCGIDIEPDPGGSARDVLIEDCVVRGNRGSGIQVYKQAFAVTIRRCTIEDNRGYGVLALGAVDGVIADNRIRGNGLAGAGLRARTRDYRLQGNRFANNGAARRRAAASRGPPPPPLRPDKGQIEIAADTSAIQMTANRYGDG